MNTRRSTKKSASNPVVLNAVLNEQPPFPIVGIGGSAGGLEAFLQILSHLPIDTGMAFVIIQHLSRDQESLLSEILGRATQLPVQDAQNGMKVEPNQVYVIPPNVSLTIAAGTLELTPRSKARGLFMSVDIFLLSLAEERGSQSIGVVLSGGDSDGARGLEAVKAAGGITFAQCQDSAKVDSMPNTAIATGQVDFILPPEKIAEQLVKLSRHPYLLAPAPATESDSSPPAEPEDALSRIYSLLRAATGVDFTHYKQTTLNRRIRRRMLLYRLEQLQDYAQFLESTPTEVMALYQDLLIHVTSFFRDPESFDALRRKIFPTIAKDKSAGVPVRIWVAGCATGEEAYSIAICLIEFLIEQELQIPIQIYATDISEAAIEHARAGIYTPSEVATVSPDRLHRFFVEVHGKYQICKAVREICVFARQNLIGDPPFSRLDLISCRNVLIYLGTPLQKKLLPTFHYGLKPTGFLMLGMSETICDFADLFSLVDKKHKLYAKRLVPARLDIDLTASSYSLTIAHKDSAITENLIDLEMQREADRIVLNQYAPSGVIVNAELDILQFRGQTNSYLELAPGKASLNLLNLAKADLRLELRTAIHQVNQQKTSVSRFGLPLIDGDRTRQINLHVLPFQTSDASADYFLILFEDAPLASAAGAIDRDAFSALNSQEEIDRLRQELKTTRAHLQSIIEEQQATNQDLRAANEEILSSNEELQSTNEELETAKEEIQATNEELNTINDELHRRNLESTHVSNDLQNLLTNVNIPILMLGGDLKIRRFTPAIEGIFNLISTDVGRPLSDITHRLNLPDLEQKILGVIRTLNFITQEIQDQDGHWYDLRIRPYRTIDNKIDGAVVVLVDIHDLKRSATQLIEARDYAEAIVETVREPLLVLNLDLQIITANRSFYEAFHVLPTQTERRFLFELGNGQWNIPALRSLLEAVISNQAQFQDFEVKHEFEQIGQKVMLLNARQMPTIGNTQMILLAIEDITEQKRLETEHGQLLIQEQAARSAAESANRAKDEFLSVLSHELRNPLNAMIGWAQLLREKELDETRTQHGLETIERSARTQAQLIEDILDVSRITTGKFRLNARLIKLAPVIQAAIEVVRLAADAKNISIESRLSTQPEKVLGDPMRLQQVIWNLLANAIKFTPPGGRVEVQLAYVNLHAQIQVSDTGRGISSEFLPFVFDRFRQADGSRTRSNPGLGLGLSIVRHLVELHGGTVEAESAGTDQGATFTVRLPLQANSNGAIDPSTPADPLDPPPRLQGEPGSLAGLRVLIVDDEPGMRELFSVMLAEYDVEVTTIASASEAIATLTANPQKYDVLLSDIGMPGGDGYALIRQIRSLGIEAGGQIPAAAITAYARDEDRRESIEAGFQLHLTKPIQAEQLAWAVATLAGRIDSDTAE